MQNLILYMQYWFGKTCFLERSGNVHVYTESTQSITPKVYFPDIR